MVGEQAELTRINGKFHRPLARLLLFFLFLVAAEASFNGYYEKWGLKDGADRLSVPLMVDGTGHRPFVYRQLLPKIVNVIDDALPTPVKSRLLDRLLEPAPANPGRTNLGMRQGDADNPDYAIRYYLLYNLTFAAFLATLFLMRTLCLQEGFSAATATATPIIFALFLPFLLSMGGYFYDFTELFFFVGALCLCRSRLKWLLIPVAVIATLNKESFFFFIFCLTPFVIKDRKDVPGLAILAGALLASGLTHLLNKAQYVANAGANVQIWLWGNIEFYLNPLSLLRLERTYNLIGWAGYSLVTLVLVGATARLGWRYLGMPMKRHVYLATAVNLPLFLLFCHPGETRNLSLLFPSLALFIAGTAQYYFDSVSRSEAPPAA